MRPILLELGPLKIHAYGFSLAVSFLIGSFWISRWGRKRGYREDDLGGLFFWVLASALIGSRLYYAFQHPEDFEGDWLEVFRIWRGGLSQHGGVIGAVVTAALYARARAWPFREIADLAAPAIALGEAITRLGGCFLAGCCHGIPTDLPWCVHYPQGSPAYEVWGLQGVHPSPLYLALGNLALFLFLWRVQARLLGSGRLFALYLAGSAVIRFWVDLTRYYTSGDWVTVAGLRLSHSQWLALILFGVAVVLWVRPRRAAARKAGRAAGGPGEAGGE
jgi:phosphatidylglycerol:prolipoprotein diacylglycerol transferase